MARATSPLRKHDEEASVTMGALHMRARAAATLQDLTGLFAASIAADGFRSHVCFGMDEDGRIAPLFGDARTLPARSLSICAVGADAEAIRPDYLLLPVESWHESDLFLGLGGRRTPIDAALRASLQGRAEVYATYGMALLEREQDVITASGMGLAQRQCLARLLMGERDPQIAEALGITPLAVRGHIESAMEFLSARSRAEAVSIAARRGWLAGINHEPGNLFAPNWM